MSPLPLARAISSWPDRTFTLPSSASSLVIRPIAPEQTAELRRLVLWPTKAIDDQLAPYDWQHGTVHLGAFPPVSETSETSVGDGPEPKLESDRPIAVLTLVSCPPTSSVTEAGREVQLRKFAVHPSLQGKGIGSNLLRYVIEQMSFQKAVEDEMAEKIFLHLDARQAQVGFYRRFGLETLGEPFDKYPSGDGGGGTAGLYVRMGMVV